MPQFFTMGSSQPEIRDQDQRQNSAEKRTQTKSAIPTFPDFTCEPRWYISPFDGKKKRTEDNPVPEDAQDVNFGEASEPTKSSTTISVAQAAEIRAQGRQAIQ